MEVAEGRFRENLFSQLNILTALKISLQFFRTCYLTWKGVKIKVRIVLIVIASSKRKFSSHFPKLMRYRCRKNLAVFFNETTEHAKFP